MGCRPPTGAICARIWRAPAMHRCAYAPRGDRRRREDGDRAAGAVVAAARRSRRARDSEVAGMDAGARRARAGQGAAVPHAAHGLLRGRPRSTRRALPITVLYRPPKFGWLEPLMREGRGRADVRLVPADLTGVRELFARAASAARRSASCPTRCPAKAKANGPNSSAAPAYTMTLAAKLAERAGRRLLPRVRESACRAARATTSALRPLPAALPGESATRAASTARWKSWCAMSRAVSLGLQPLQDAARRATPTPLHDQRFSSG